jgi:hypothetical protein
MNTNISETAQIIQLSAFRPRLGKNGACTAKESHVATLSETGKNHRLRRERHTEWRRVDALREYWRTTLKMDDAIDIVQNHNLPEGYSHPVRDPKDRWTIIAKWREAIMQQLLMPAPTAREITSKRAVFKAGDHKYTDVKPERIERAIADDVEFLKAHPVRQSRKRGQEQ